MRIGVLRETGAKERRVALTPTGVVKLTADGHTIIVEVGAGLRSGIDDAAYRSAGASVAQRSQVLADSQVVVQITGPSPGDLPQPEWASLGDNHVLVGLHDPLWRPEDAAKLAATGATIVSLELVPRITRAQSMDVLSSMATVAGYQAVLLAASRSAKMFPMLMTAAGTVPATKVLVLGAGVAGLQAIATARRLGAIVSGYDIRPAAVEQIRSLGAKAVEFDLESNDSEDAGGYAKKQSDDAGRRQQEQLTPFVAEADVVITTAAIPGAESPELLTTEMVEAMVPGSVIVDLAAERGGNCRLTDADSEVIHEGVILLGPTDLAAKAADSASLMFSNNVVALLKHFSSDEGDFMIDLGDEIMAGTVVATDGDVCHPRVRERLGLRPLETDSSAESTDTGTTP